MSKFWRHFITDGNQQADDAYFGIHGRRAGTGETAQVEVRRVDPGSPAEKAGILEGDLLVELATRRLRSVDDLHDLLAELPAGKPLLVQLLRRGQRLERWVWLDGEPPREVRSGGTSSRR